MEVLTHALAQTKQTLHALTMMRDLVEKQIKAQEKQVPFLPLLALAVEHGGAGAASAWLAGPARRTPIYPLYGCAGRPHGVCAQQEPQRRCIPERHEGDDARELSCIRQPEGALPLLPTGSAQERGSAGSARTPRTLIFAAQKGSAFLSHLYTRLAVGQHVFVV